MPAGKFTFSKEDRLYLREDLSALFETGKGFQVHPFRVIYKVVNTEIPKPVKIAFTASKRNFKRAVDRNRIKRLMREAWRLNYSAFAEYVETRGKEIHIAIIYTARELPHYAETESKIILILQRLKNLHELGTV